jgi:hypothetical protein
MLVELNLLVIANRPNLLALFVDFLGLEAVYPVFWTEFTDLTAGQSLGRADYLNPIQDYFYGLVLARCIVVHVFADFRHAVTPLRVKI